ncbi:Cys-tRNA(Pro) deacylase [Jeotgalibacillus marinus]|uniref:Cys-tRNA(Pro)/Cys-tRNA(Cys) deacylase n=1 Tax=Jeotgalibacillus marinus TaxID=86667 RepID=A0ABV3Q1V7_9BACL
MAKSAKGKTNAMRKLDSSGIMYERFQYDIDDGLLDGASVAVKINRTVEEVFKTLVTHGSSKQVYVFLVPVQRELSLKKAASAVEEKKIDMVPVKDIQSITGYIKGGCSPIGMKKKYPTFVANQATNLSSIIVSAGQVGTQVELSVSDLLQVTEAKLVDLT